MAADDVVVGIGDFFTCRDYETKHYSFGDVSVSLDSLQAASTDFDLTGQVIWTAAHLGAWFFAHPTSRARWTGSAALELGAGPGLTGMVAAQYCSRMVFTDNEDEVLALLERNLAHVPKTCGAVVRPLHWGDAAHHAALEAEGNGSFPLIIGCDIVYWSVSIAPLFQTVPRLLARPFGVFILGFFDRKNGMRLPMLAAAETAGLRYRRIANEDFMPAPPPPAMEHFLDRCYLYEFRWAENPDVLADPAGWSTGVPAEPAADAHNSAAGAAAGLAAAGTAAALPVEVGGAGKAEAAAGDEKR